jgi:Kef-type K+ transport system membrane component KefB
MPHSPENLLLEMFVIFVWAKFFGEIFERLGLPAVLGEILAGVILGPFATGFIAHFDESILSLAEIGAVFLLFTVGLETKPEDLLSVGHHAIGVAAAGVAVPFFLGFGFIYLQSGSAHEATFVGAAMVATSVGITARVLSDMRVLTTRVAQIILGAAVFDDILGMVLLAIVAGLAASGTIQWVQLAVLSIEAVGFALFMIFLAPRLVRRMRPGLERMSIHDAPLILALAICLGLSVAAAEIGMAAIIGAFFAGLVFAEYSPQWNLQPRIHAITELLAPFFFFMMGAQLDVRVFLSAEVVTTALIVSLLAIISKVMGCGAPMLHEGWKTAIRVGVGMMPRGEVALIVAAQGLAMKMISQRAYGIVIFMTAVTTVLAPPLLRALFRETPPAPRPLLEPELPARTPAVP